MGLRQLICDLKDFGRESYIRSEGRSSRERPDRGMIARRERSGEELREFGVASDILGEGKGGYSRAQILRSDFRRWQDMRRRGRGSKIGGEVGCADE